MVLCTYGCYTGFERDYSIACPAASLSIIAISNFGNPFTFIEPSSPEISFTLLSSASLLKVEIYYGILAGRDFFSTFYYDDVEFDKEIPLSTFEMPTGNRKK